MLIKGLAQYFKKLEEEAKKKQKASEAGLKDACLFIEGRIKEKISEAPRGGREYTRYKPYRQVKASAPGEPPATDTSNLIHHVKSEIQRSADAVIGLVGIFGKDTALYAAALEFGSTANNLAPRPFLDVTVAENRKEITQRLTEHTRYKS
jgi:hypothetical protein